MVDIEKIAEKTFQYNSVREKFDVEFPYEINENDFYLFDKDLTTVFNKYGKDGWEVVSYKFKQFLFYTESDLKKYNTRHSVPFTSCEVCIIFKKEVITYKTEEKNEK